ncbi:MAG: hypothetical protein ABIG69_11855 [Bacteroidota bacterium]
MKLLKKTFENMLAMLLGSLLFLLVLIIVMPNTYYSILNEYKINSYRSEEMVYSLAKMCNYSNGNIEKIQCVNNYFSMAFTYNNNKTGDVKPNDLFVQGGNCMDSSWFYCSVFEQMGLECDVVIASSINHSYNIVTVDDIYCILDQQLLWCV